MRQHGRAATPDPPTSFHLDDKRLRRAGLDYREWARVREHESLGRFIADVPHRTLYAFTTRAERYYNEVRFNAEDALLFGPETRGLPLAQLRELPSEQCLRLPMLAQSRSVNLANSVAIAVYEAWRQLDFCGASKACARL